MPVEYQLCGCCIPDGCPHCEGWGVGNALYFTWTCEACPTNDPVNGLIMQRDSPAPFEGWTLAQVFFIFSIGCVDSPTFGPAYNISSFPGHVWHLQQSFFMQCSPFLVMWHPAFSICNGPFAPPDVPPCVGTAVDIHPNGACLEGVWTGSDLTLVVPPDSITPGSFPAIYDAVNDWWTVVIPGGSGGTWNLYFEMGFMWEQKVIGPGTPHAPRVCFSVSCSPPEVFFGEASFNCNFGHAQLS